MSEEKKDYNTIEEETVSGQETEEILKEDDENLTEKTACEECQPEEATDEAEDGAEEKGSEKKDFSEKRKKTKKMKK